MRPSATGSPTAGSAAELWARARAAGDTGRWSTGLRLAQRALRQWEREPDGDPRLRVRILIALAYNHSELGHTHTARALLDEAVATGPVVMPAARVARGMIMVRTGHPDDALEDFDLAVAELGAAQTPDEWDDLAGALINRGLMHMTAGRLTAAAADTEAAGRIAAALDRDDITFMAGHNLGYVRYLAGDLPGALAAMEAAANAWPAAAADGVSLLDRARVLAAAGLVAEAGQFVDRALDFFRAHRATADLVDAYGVRAELDLFADDPEAAARHGLLAARTAARRGNRPATLASRMLQLRAARLLRTSAGPGTRARRATRDAQRADELAAEFAVEGMSEFRRSALLLQADALLDAGRTDAAAEIADRARSVVGQPALAARLHGRLIQGRLELAAGRRSAGQRQIRRGLDDLATFQASFGSQDLQAAASIRGRELAMLGLRTAVESGSPAAIFQWLERARGVSTRLPAVRPVRDPALAEALAALRVADEQVRQAILAGRAEPQLEQRRRELRRRARSQAWTAAGGGAVRQPPSLSSVQRQLVAHPDRPTVVAFIRGAGNVHALVLTARTAFFTDLGPFAGLRDLMRRLVADLDLMAIPRVPEPVRAVARRSLDRGLAQVSDALLEPLLARLPPGPLLITGLGVLSTVPWSMIPALSRRPISVNSSVTAAISGHGGAAAEDRGVLAVAGPGVPMGGEEATRIARLYPGATLLTGAAATGRAVLEHLPDGGLVHIAAHGHHETESPLFSSVLLDDGPLYGYDIAPNPTLPAHVVLSSCDVGRNDVRSGEPLGLAAALLRSGVGTVVAGVSRVADEVAASVMTRYHLNLLTGLRPAAALTGAVSAAAEAGAVAPFSCFGVGF